MLDTGKSLDLNKPFREALLYVAVDDLADVIRARSSPMTINERIARYIEERRCCREAGVDVGQYDKIVCGLLSKLKFMPQIT